jgi:hypothetical protein
MFNSFNHKRKIKTPEELLEVAYEYFDWCLANPLTNEYYVRSKRVVKEIPRPFTMIGLSMFMGVSSSYLRVQKHRKSDEFVTVYTRVKAIMYEQRLIHAIVGIYNYRLIAHELSITNI